MTIVNLTPHPLVITRDCPVCDGLSPCGQCSGTGRYTETIESSGIARCATTEEVVGEVNGIPVVRTTFGAVEGLPEADPQPRVFVVSSITAQAVPHRKDVFVPARPIRDQQGRIIACMALGRVR
jgi:hypothetical protein